MLGMRLFSKLLSFGIMAQLPRLLLTSFCLTGRIHNPASWKFAESLQRLVARAQKFTIATQQRHKRYYDAKHAPAVNAVNDEVYFPLLDCI